MADHGAGETLNPVRTGLVEGLAGGYVGVDLLARESRKRHARIRYGHLDAAALRQHNRREHSMRLPSNSTLMIAGESPLIIANPLYCVDALESHIFQR